MEIEKELMDFGEFLNLSEREIRVFKMFLDFGKPLYKARAEREYNLLVSKEKPDLKYKERGVTKTIDKLTKCFQLLKQKDTPKDKKSKDKKSVGADKEDKQRPRSKKIEYEVNQQRLEWIRKLTDFIEMYHLEKIINKIPSDLRDDQKVEDARRYFQKEKILYDMEDETGLHYWEARKNLRKHYDTKKFTELQDSYRRKLLAWTEYYLGLKKIPSMDKHPLLDSKARANAATEEFIEVLQIAKSQDDIDSAFAGLPLVYELILGEHEKAIKIIELAEKKCKNKAALYNTKGIVERHANKPIEALRAFTKAYEEGKKEKDLRTCGNALNNQAKIMMYNIFLQFKELHMDKDFLIQFKRQILSTFKNAEESYKEYERTHTWEKAGFHLSGIEKEKGKLENDIKFKII